MPFKSQKQRSKFYELEKQGKLKKGTADKWAKETPNIASLPERSVNSRPIKDLTQLRAVAKIKKLK
jgi:hypothetical protein